MNRIEKPLTEAVSGLRKPFERFWVTRLAAMSFGNSPLVWMVPTEWIEPKKNVGLRIALLVVAVVLYAMAWSMDR